MKNIALLMLIASVIMVSGCIGPGPTATSSYGVNILSFDVFPLKPESGETVDFDLEVENTGGMMAEDVHAFLGLSSDWTISDDKCKEIGDLEGPDEEQGIKGEGALISWKATAPEKSQGIPYPYNPSVRVFYKYKTIASSSIPALLETEYKYRSRSGESIPSQTTTTVSKGPIGVKIQSYKPVIKVGKDETKSFRVTIIVENLGNGEVFNKEKFESLETDGTISYDDLYVINMTIKAPEIIEAEDCDALNGKHSLNVKRGSDSYRCRLKIDGSRMNPEEHIPITVILEYGYFIDSTRSVSVIEPI